MADYKIIEEFEADPTLEIEEEYTPAEDSEELEELAEDAINAVEAAGGTAGDWVKVGDAIYMVVSPLGTRVCAQFVKGPNAYNGIMERNTCSCCHYLIRKKGHYLCKKSRTEL